jgi:hypothetical protein
MEEQQNEQDRHLQTPAESNRDKHINFLANERNEVDPADENSAVHFGDSTYQTKEEFEQDKGSDLADTDADGIRVSQVSDDTYADRVGAGDRSGTSELSSQQNSQNSNLAGSDASNASAEPGM